MGSSRFWLAWAVYGPVGLLAFAWAHSFHGSALSSPRPGWLAPTSAHSLGLGLLIALGVAIVTIGSTRVLVARTQWARNLHMALRAMLAGASFRQLLILAVLSACAEELLFRAAIQPSLGLIPTSILFGVLHISPRGTGFAWPVWATLMGGVFGVLFEASGHLLPPVLAHALINYENMQYICSYDPTPLDTSRLRAHVRDVRG